MPDTQTPEQIIAELQAKLRGEQPQITPSTVKIGGQDVSLSDPQALATALAEHEERTKREIESLKRLAEQTRYVQPEQDSRNGGNTYVPPSEPPSLTLEQWAEAMNKDVVSGFDLALSRALGLKPGIKATSAINAMAATTQAMAMELQNLKGQLMEERVRAEGERFVESHPDYEPSEKNAQIIENIRESSNLPYTAQGLHLAYLEAVNSGYIKPKQIEQVQQNQDFTQVPQQFGLPSLRPQVGSGYDSQVQSIFDTVSKLSPEEGLKTVKDLYNKGIIR